MASPSAAIRVELEKALGEIKSSHAPIVYMAGYIAGLRLALGLVEKNKEE